MAPIKPRGTRSSKAVPRPPIVEVTEAIKTRFGALIADTAICLRTPVPETVPVAGVALPAALREFVLQYEPKTKTTGLYSHQARILEQLGKKQLPNVVLTTATGSGKSLVFWAWVFEALRRDPRATAIACFPTQALLWGQADRMARLSQKDSLVRRGEQPYAGTIALGRLTIPWTVWHGTQESRDMREHQESDDFQASRLRITTVDKVHWSLFHGKHADFLQGLRAVVLDEAHIWHGLAGANVRAMLDRLRLSLDMLGAPHPAFFLASATLSEPAEFAANLTGCEESSFVAADDRGSAKLGLVPTAKLEELLTADCTEPDGSPKRYVLLLKPDEDPLSASSLLGDKTLVGTEVNALCFVQSKFAGHRLRDELEKQAPGRKAVAYDGDMTAEERRRTEKLLFGGGESGMTIVATNALEVGVDLPELDLIVMDELPTRRADLLQRLGRVGRTVGRPGLAVLCLGYSPLEDRLLEAPDKALSTDGVKPLPLPLHLDGLRLRTMRAAFNEWMWRLKQREVAWEDFNAALERYWGQCVTYGELDAMVKDQLSDLVDLDDGSWYYRGFRASASQGKRKLVLKGTDRAVAQVEDIAVFRDAHPEGVYLGHRGQRFRIVGYRGRFKLGKWTDPRSDIVLGKFIHALEAIEVVEERRRVATRGRWKDSFDLYLEKDIPDDSEAPAAGKLEYGIWNFLRRFDGYVEIDLSGRNKAKAVSLGEVSERFKEALATKEDFPFLHGFSYRTLGWRWKIARILTNAEHRRMLAPALEGLLHAYLCDVVECARGDLTVKFEPTAGEFRVLDSTPGGNGLSSALLQPERASGALVSAARAARSFARRPAAAFERFLAEDCHVEAQVSAKEVADAVDAMARAWSR
ncbi:helicase-related protein [Polyangium aurulentum]|uniref:helicase-related protein n=1 Tax=Polyangium aurulentum TaxID=2567896 RepID=UPI0010ADDD06|nr:helicase-related protein [Polyangium aurulentum]UQA61388.1 DEAD/DEAH box helicase [Polyangium aurulentum]